MMLPTHPVLRIRPHDLDDSIRRGASGVERALHSVARNDVGAARGVIAMKGEIQTEVQLAEQHQAQRLVADAPNRIAAYSVEMEVIEKLKRIYYFGKRMAKAVEVDAAPAVAQKA